MKPAGVPTGTAVSVADLFYCVPARRKFLKSETTELGHIASLVTHYALAHPGKHFVLKTPTQEIVNVPPVETMAERVYQLFGRQMLDEMVEIPATTAPIRAAITEPELDEAGRAAEISVRGFISRPEVQRSNRNGIYVFVNRRLVRDRLLLHAIHEAYRNILPAGIYPVALLFVDAVLRGGGRQRPSGKNRGALPPLAIRARFHAGRAAPGARQGAAGAQFRGSCRSAAQESASAAAGFANGAAAAAASASAGAGGPMAAPRAVIPPMPGDMGLGSRGVRLDAHAGPARGAALPLRRGRRSASPPTPRPTGIAERFRQAAAQAASPAGEMPASAASLAELKPLGQVNASFIVAVNNEGLWIIDQHVAHERVLFEQHQRARREGLLSGQRLLVPIVAELAPRQRVILDRIAEELSANGFDVTPMGAQSVAIQAAPAGISAADARTPAGRNPRRHRARAPGHLHRFAAIENRGLHGLSRGDQGEYAAGPDQDGMAAGRAGQDRRPMSCPHGRPVLLRYSLREIERAFKRV